MDVVDDGHLAPSTPEAPLALDVDLSTPRPPSRPAKAPTPPQWAPANTHWHRPA